MSHPRRATESVVGLLCLVLILRCVIVEPFGVPTGSMAMTMWGNHKACDCPRCGYRVVVGSSAKSPGERAVPDRAYHTAWCPNCGYSNLPLAQEPETTGDRLLVEKTTYECRRPRRWEIAVFRNPSDPSKPYVKRVIGLPGERIHIRDGDVFVNDQICRKSLAEFRPLRVLVFDQSFQPPYGWRQRWVLGHLASSNGPLDERHDTPADDIVRGADLVWPRCRDESDERWVTYRHWLLDEQREEVIRDWFAYNGTAIRHELSEVHDFSIEFEVEPEIPTRRGTLLMMLTDGRNAVEIELPIVADSGGDEGIRIQGAPAPTRLYRRPTLMSGKRQQVEFALVDRRISLAIDGQEVFAPIDLPAPVSRRAVSRPVSLGFRGAAATIRRFRIYRDVYYTNSGRNGVHDSWPLGADEYFMLGDNSPNSEDSRHWVRPGIPFDLFLGRPILLHQPSRWSRWGTWQLQGLDWQRIGWVR